MTELLGELRRLISATPSGDGVQFVLREGAEPSKTPLGHLMLKLVAEVGMKSGPFRLFLGRFGTLRIEMSVSVG